MLLTLAAPAAAANYPPSLGNVFWLFAKAGAFVFGSGLAIVPFLYGELVQSHAWLNDRQFLDAVAVAMITPGPAGTRRSRRSTCRLDPRRGSR